MRYLSGKEAMIVMAIIIYSFVPTFGGLVRVAELLGGPMITSPNPRALMMPVPIILHVLASFVFCLVGGLQLLPQFRQHAPKWHRRAGIVVAFCGCVSAATGLWMTHLFDFPTELQGALLYTVRMVLSAMMIVLIVSAVFAARAGQIGRHRTSMVRAYAIGQGASTQTFLGLAFIAVFEHEPLGLERDIMMVFAWALNLAIAELVLRRSSAFVARHGLLRRVTPPPPCRHKRTKIDACHHTPSNP